MRRLLLFALLASTLALSGCFHATVVTGKQAGNQTIEVPFANSFVFGLVPPSTVEAQSRCGDSGVARVETQISFVNGLIGALTFNLYTPMTIEVTCAAGGSMSDAATAPSDLTLPQSASDVEIRESISKAASRTAETGEPTSIRFVP